ncbi:uncharacterized protein LOC106880799 [Octopus bimaculoides]|uniref:RING-type domain-containing protein n=1 Tax=Octopus bimaculoides TaxID=37653 RepID=A0A0L8FVX4_OCTBM|nr:uncharacterized protein LOC106880799 [Octopus bimaculoides]|eukprot:XP_014786402.1 PREDICTED: uncharacterized protein LOC106880799 [Octopus bimaculoides]
MLFWVAKMQDNQQNPQQHLSMNENPSDSSDDASGTENPDDLPHSNVTATSITIKGARPKVYSSLLTLSKSKSARFSQKTDEGQENACQENASVDLNFSSLTTSSSFLSNRHSILPDIKPLNSIQENPCNHDEPLQRWKNAGKALRKALSSSTSSFAVSSPLTSYVNQTFHFSTQTLPLKGKGAMRNSRYHLARRNLLDNDSIAVCETSKLLNDMPNPSPILSTNKMPLLSTVDSANVDINIDNQAELLKNSVAISLPKPTPYTKHQKDDNCSKSENEIDPKTDSCMLERSPGMFNLRADDCDLPQITDHNNSNCMLSSSHTDLNLSRYQKQIISYPHQLKTASSPFTAVTKISTSPVCSFEDSSHSIQPQTFKMLECRLSRLISSDDKSFFELSSSDSDITDCSSIFEDDYIRNSSHQQYRGTAQNEEQEPKKQKRKSQTLRKHRNGETACSSDSIHEGTKNYLRQKKKMKGGLEETVENVPLIAGGCLAALHSNVPCLGLSHSSETDSDAAAKTVTPHWRLRKRSGIVSKRHENTTENNSKDNEEFKLPPLPSKQGAKGNWRYMRNSAPVKERSGNCNPTDPVLGNLQSSRPSLVNYSSSSSLDILNVCDPDQALPPSWNIVDSLNTEADKASKALPTGGVAEDFNSCGQEKNTEKSQIRTWPLLDDLYSYSNENVSSLINVGCSQNDVHCSDEDDYTGLNQAHCACNKCKPSTWDFWDLPPSESTLIDIAIDADCHSESDTHSDLERDSDSADADDEFECDCIHCLQMREVLGHRHNSEGASFDRGDSDLTTTTAAIVANSSSLPYTMSTSSSLQFATRLSTPLNQDHNHWSTALSEDSQLDIAELNPLDLLLMRQDARRDMLELMFQNVILQMLAVHPDLLNDQAPPPAPLTLIENLQTVVVTQEDVNEEASCPICLCPWELEEKMAKLPCQHLFHMLCIRAWLIKSGTCPVCRHVL